MPVIPFLEYLEERPATAGLAIELARVLVLRGRADLVAAPGADDAPRRLLTGPRPRAMVDGTVPLPGGRELRVRPVTAADVDALAALYERLDDDDRLRRFFSPYRPDRSFFERMASADERGGAGGVVAVVTGPDETEHLVGEAGYTTRERGGTPELAITVDKDWRGWLGAYLLDALVATAAARGIPNLRAEILTANPSMLALVQSRGYVTVDHPDWSVVSVLIGTHGRTPTWTEPATRPRLLVEMPGGRWPAEADARAQGVDVLVCPGPGRGRTRCPLLQGGECPLAADADAIVVHPAPDDPRWRDLLDAHARAHPGVPVVIDTPGTNGTAALIALAPRFAKAAQAATRSDT